jgi:hypothetical protein
MVEDLQKLDGPDNEPEASTISNVHVVEADPVETLKKLQQLESFKDMAQAELSTVSNIHGGGR